MKKLGLVILLITLTISFSCKDNKKETEVDTEMEMEDTTPAESTVSQELMVKLEPKSDSQVSGSVFFKEENGMVTMTAMMSGLTEGTHAIHIHEKADCSAADGTSTGGHWNPTGQPHGKWGSEEGYHKGDIGNFEANADGKGAITLVTNEWCIGCGDATKDIVGKAIIVHDGTDDFVTQPTGAAGGRVSCGGIIQ
ncbi:Cu-Zn family superoxide dismutase [Flavobacteriaceae bacterium MAR_2010_72]|nr:Cu-Zn family superoxide dismutase [Flavobacteriaceae bacterium MAR_2010_72]TVZ59268.1 Cu-Zn family superoxide dismutase [Flavobacteriaceae bacterium MAR_2010_105]